MRKLIYILPAILLLAACSTTSALEEGDVLYTGIKRISFNDKTNKPSPESQRGVVTAVGNAVGTVSALISGTGEGSTPAAEVVDSTLVGFTGRGAARAEARAQRAREEQYNAVQDEVEAVLSYAPNGALFGSSKLVNPMQFGLRIHNRYHDAKRRFGKWMFRRFGEAPVLITTVAPQTRVKLATNQLHNYGFFQARTTYEVIPQKNPRKAKLAYHVETGPLYLIDSLRYNHFTPQIDSLLRTTRRQRLIKKGAAFSAANLVNERKRIETLMRDNGYYYFAAANVGYEADTVRRPRFVSLRVNPVATAPEAFRPWSIGKIHITLHDNASNRIDSIISRRYVEYAFCGQKPPVRPRLWMYSITHRPRSLYTLSDQTNTLEKLSSMGILSNISIDYLPSTPDDDCDTLDVFITATLDKPYESSFETNVTLKSNQQFGPGVSYELAKKNAFRAGERIAWKIFGSYEWHLGRNRGASLNSYELGSELSLSFPRFLLMKQRHQRFPASTKLALTADWKNRSGYFNALKFGADIVYNWHKHPMRLHELTILDLQYDRTLSTTTAFEEILQHNPVLRVNMRNQFIPAISYLYTHTTNSTRAPLWMQFFVKESGHLTSGIYSLCGYSWTERDKHIMGSPYAQFLKLTAEVHKTWNFNTRFSLATRIFCGSIFTYGNSIAAPYSELFYVGGANSVRGFAARSIGPGSFSDPVRRDAYISQTGDFKLEANAELRVRLLGNLHGAVFLDAGNVWLMHHDPLRMEGLLSGRNLKQIAVGTGIGLRYDLTFLVVRVDWGIGLHAPTTEGRHHFYNIGRFRDGNALHLAIGYPF